MADSKEVKNGFVKVGSIFDLKYIPMAKSISKMLFARAQLRDMGSASASIYTFIGDSFEIGEVIFGFLTMRWMAIE